MPYSLMRLARQKSVFFSVFGCVYVPRDISIYAITKITIEGFFRPTVHLTLKAKDESKHSKAILLSRLAQG